MPSGLHVSIGNIPPSSLVSSVRLDEGSWSSTKGSLSTSIFNDKASFHASFRCAARYLGETSMSCASPAEVARYEARRSASDSDRGRPRSTGVDLGPTSSRLHASSSRRSQVVCDFTSDLQGRRGPHGGAPSHRSSAATGEVVRSGATWCDVDRGCRVVSGLVGEGGGRWVGRWGLGCFGFVMLMVLGSCATTFGCQNGSKQDQ